ncbi:MAG: DUF4390 domain-containing protein [Desulfotignum sp.]|jgi:hypothetical protein|nr:DUF4390 domain-containing protein [Desulfotignum sp.]
MTKNMTLRLQHGCLLLIFTVLLQLFVPPVIRADTAPLLTNIKLANTRDDLLTYFEVTNAFDEKITQAVQNGIPRTFSFYVSLYKTSDSWRDKKIADIAFTSTIKYNSLKQEYTVFRPWKDENPSVTQSFEKAKAWMTEIDNLKVIPLEDLVKAEKYQIRIKAELSRVTLPFSLHYVFFFVSFWDVETDWYLINFTY